MASYNIYHKDGRLLTRVKSVTYNDSFMGESTVSCKIQSAEVVKFTIGDYVDYKGRRFYLANVPSVTKTARSRTTNGAFIYDAVKFTSAAGYDMTRCKFRDVVLASLQNVYHTNFAATSFSFYCPSLIGFGERLQANLDRLYTGDDAWVVKVRLADGSDHVCNGQNSQDNGTAMGNKDVAVSISNETCWDALQHVKDDFGVNFVLQDKVVNGKNKKVIVLGANGTVLPYFFRYGKNNGVFKFDRSVDDNQAIVTLMRAYGNTTNMPIRYYNKQEGAEIANTINVQNLMLPGYGVSALSTIVQNTFNTASHMKLTNRIRAAVNNAYGANAGTFEELSQYLRFSDDKDDPYIVAVKQEAAYGTREGEVFFDGSGDYDDIHPSIEWLGGKNKIVLAEQIDDNGQGSEETNTPDKETFSVTVNLGFNPADYIPFGKTSFTVSMRSGMCGGRSFECIGVTYGGGTLYNLKLKRLEDTSLDLWFPYKDFNVKEGDEFVLLDIDMPNEYVDGTALEELLPQAIVALLDNCDTKYKYSLEVDNIAMAKQHELAQTPSESIYNMIAAGCEIWFGDADLDFNIGANSQTVTGRVLIDKVEIKEEDGGIPKYNLTLVDEVSVGTLEAIQKQIHAITSGKITINGGNSVIGGGGYSEVDIQNICRALGDARYLRLTGGTVSGSVGINGTLGVNGDVDVNGVLHATKFVVDNLEVMEAKHISGKIISSPASAEIVRIDKNGTVWKLMFAADDVDGNPVENMFVEDDMIFCEQFRVDYGGGKYVQNKVYWRRAIEVGNEEIDGKWWNYVTVNIADVGNSKYTDMPEVGDTIVVLGNLDANKHGDRQNATISSPIGTFLYKGKAYHAPYECQYVGIGNKGFVLPDPINVKSPELTVVNADYINLSSGGTIGGQDEWCIYSVDWDAEVMYGLDGSAGLKHTELDPRSVDVSEDWTEFDYPEHIGDYLVTRNGYCYRFVLQGTNTYVWEAVEDELLLDLQAKINGIQQSGITTTAQFAEMWSQVVDTDSGKKVLAKAGVLTTTNYDEGENSWWSGVKIYGNQVEISADHKLTLNVGAFVVNGDNFSVDEDGRMTALNARLKGYTLTVPNYVTPENFDEQMYSWTTVEINHINYIAYDYDFIDKGNIVVFYGNLSSILDVEQRFRYWVDIQLPGTGSNPWHKYDKFDCIQMIGKRFYIFNQSDSNRIGVSNSNQSIPINIGQYAVFEMKKNSSGKYFWEMVIRGNISEFENLDE